MPDDLDSMQHFTEVQYGKMVENLPREANDRYSEGKKPAFIIHPILGNLPRILRGATRANPLRLVTKLPIMIATALSVIVDAHLWREDLGFCSLRVLWTIDGVCGVQLFGSLFCALPCFFFSADSRSVVRNVLFAVDET